MADDDVVFRPGQVVPASGIYRCDSGCGHAFESTDVKGHRFPPVPRGCGGAGWVLERASASH